MDIYILSALTEKKKTTIECHHLNHLDESILMSTQNIHFYDK